MCINNYYDLQMLCDAITRPMMCSSDPRMNILDARPDWQKFFLPFKHLMSVIGSVENVK